MLIEAEIPSLSGEQHLDAVADRMSARSGAFTDNMRLPVHRWFRYSAGFSAAWVEHVIRDRRQRGYADLIFDPFCGSGTTLLAAEAVGVPSAGTDAHTFVNRIGDAKLAWHVDPDLLVRCGDELILEARRAAAPDVESPDLLRRCYSEDILRQLMALRSAYEKSRFEPAIKSLLWLALTAILRECSRVGTAQWQYILPNRSKTKVAEPFEAFRIKLETFHSDMLAARACWVGAAAELREDDARHLTQFEHLQGQVTLVITSPPYPNNYDYADATRLEMTFWGEVERWGDLQGVIRRHLVRSCSQHAGAEKLVLDDMLAHSAIEPIRSELSQICNELAIVRETKGGRKAYHTMVAAYFVDMAQVWIALRRLCASPSEVCMVIGDSAPYGVHVPVERWMGDLALAAGFSAPRFEKLRDRNVKWKNRKHRVPLHEGRLWVRG